jgi:hypothetical protein
VKPPIEMQSTPVAVIAALRPRLAGRAVARFRARLFLQYVFHRCIRNLVAACSATSEGGSDNNNRDNSDTLRWFPVWVKDPDATYLCLNSVLRVLKFPD